MLALALSKLSDEEYWVEIETFERTPDTRLHYINQSSGHNVIQTRNIENVDWEENVDDIMEVIGKKCRRAYPGDYLLVVHARHVGKVFNLDRVIEEMEKMRSPFLEAWVVAAIGEDHLKVVRVAPGHPVIDLKLSIEFRSLGLTFLPLPSIPASKP
jgi:hypothetical protein